MADTGLIVIAAAAFLGAGFQPPPDSPRPPGDDPAAACREVYQGCSVLHPCCSSLSCQPGEMKCYHKPRQAGEPCSLGFSCGEGLSCQPGSQKCYHSPRQLGEPCSAGYGCAPGLSCQPGSQKCYHSPRWPAEPCSAGYSCGPGLECIPFAQRCYPALGDPGDESYCLGLRSRPLADFAVRSGATYTYGTGVSGSAGFATSQEVGVVYGQDGEYGCYVTSCQGWASDVSTSGYGSVGRYTTWAAVAGPTVVTTGGGGEVVSDYVGEVLSPMGQQVGYVEVVSLGISGLPTSISNLSCDTDVAAITLGSSQDCTGVNQVDAGSLASAADARAKCPSVCGIWEGTWTGDWTPAGNGNPPTCACACAAR